MYLYLHSIYIFLATENSCGLLTKKFNNRKTIKKVIQEKLPTDFLLTFAKVNPEVAVLCSANFSHFSGVTCLATKLWADLISGKGAACKCIRKRVFIRKKKLRQTHVSAAFRWEKTGFKIFACNILHSFKTSSNIGW